MTPKISPAVVATMAPHDQQRERRIEALGNQFLLQRTHAARQEVNRRIVEEVNGRSPDAIRIIEVAKGLR